MTNVNRQLKIGVLLCIILILICVEDSFSLATEYFQAPTFVLNDLDGNQVSSDSFFGKKPALIMFWATW